MTSLSRDKEKHRWQYPSAEEFEALEAVLDKMGPLAEGLYLRMRRKLADPDGALRQATDMEQARILKVNRTTLFHYRKVFFNHGLLARKVNPQDRRRSVWIFQKPEPVGRPAAR